MKKPATPCDPKVIYRRHTEGWIRSFVRTPSLVTMRRALLCGTHMSNKLRSGSASLKEQGMKRT